VQGIIVFGACTISTIFWVFPLTAFAVLKLLIPVPGFRRVLTRWIMAIGEIWVSINAAVFRFVNATRWDVRGLEGLEPDKWYLVIANHQTWIDIVALQTVLNRRIPFLKFFLKQELIWFPFLGIAWWGMDMPFMKRYSKSYLAKNPHKKGKDLEATRKACEKFRYTPTSVINFIEGTPGGAPKFWAMCYGEFDRVIIDIRKRPIEQWMLDGDYINDRNFRSQFHQWLTRIWREKDERIGAIRQAAS
jgi:1-acyl-sn-glycerol-3-phosphate acyltransferase